ncbi:MAG TPA: dynamin family protein [Chthoniobacteraceae bacterium]|jgi:small GTP-binding protein|nr:dynamin family protein [Chthoniobacteraceae bacterium]
MSDYTASEKQRLELAQALNGMSEALNGLPVLQGMAAKVLARAQEVEADRFSILVVGSFSRGKSTLLNAFLGQELLPQEAVPSTAIITVLTYQKTPQVQVHFRESGGESLSLEEFKHKYLLDVDGGVTEETEEDPDLAGGAVEANRVRRAVDRFSHVDYAEVGFPIELCKHGVQLVDTPGFEDELVRTNRARDFLMKADAVIYLLEAGQALTQSDKEQLAWMTAQGKTNLFFVLNKWDLLELMERGRQDKIEKVIQRLRVALTQWTTIGAHDLFDQRVIRTNALGAVVARQQQPVDEAQLQASNVPLLERTLERFLSEDRTQARNRAVLADARNYAQVFAKDRQRTLAALGKNVEDLKGVRAKIEPNLERLRRIRDHICQYLDARALTLHRTLIDSLREKMRAIDVKRAVLGVDGVGGFDLSVIGKVLIFEKFSDLWHRQGDKYKDRIQKELEWQVKRLLEKTAAAWQTQYASLQVREEGLALVEYLKREASDYLDVISEIDGTLGGEQIKPLDIQVLVAGWLDTGISNKDAVSVPVFDSGGFAIDLSPMLAGILADLLVDHVAHAIPVVGTLIALGLTFWRNQRNIASIKNSIVELLEKAFHDLPTSEQSRELLTQIQAKFDDLKNLVTGNMNLEIKTIKGSLDDAIAKVQQGTKAIEAERARWDDVQGRMQKELSAIERTCVVG